MNTVVHPLAITMWDFSWIERRWSGAGFESWERALDELCERGYDAVRIDAFPHLLHKDKDREWLLFPVWYENDWGSPYKNRVRVYPEIIEFIRKCKERKIKVALSSWFREDSQDIRMSLDTPEAMAECWKTTIELIGQAGLLDAILYVDLCNEFPGDFWAPYFKNDPPWMTWSCWHTDCAMAYMRKAIELLREAYPTIPYCFSFDGENTQMYRERDVSFFDMAEHHIWATKLNQQEFYRQVGQAKDGRFTPEAYHLLADNAFDVYSARPEYWRRLLTDGIRTLAADVRAAGLPLATTECWAITDYKDFPLLRWDWVKDLCELGVETACDTEQWALLATSNFAAPQFAGMWRDREWHRRQTERIHAARVPKALQGSVLEKAMIWQKA